MQVGFDNIAGALTAKIPGLYEGKAKTAITYPLPKKQKLSDNSSAIVKILMPNRGPNSPQC